MHGPLNVKEMSMYVIVQIRQGHFYYALPSSPTFQANWLLFL